MRNILYLDYSFCKKYLHLHNYLQNIKMKTREVLDLLEISRATLTNYVKLGLIKVKERPFGRYDYCEEDVRKLIDPEYKSIKKPQ